MNKLSEEQAEWLIEEIDRLKFNHTQLAVNDNFEIPIKEFKALINRCTEKEFPEFLLNKGAAEYSLAVRQSGSNGVYISVSDPDWKSTQMELDCEEFKEFTGSCNKIVEWLDQNGQ